MINILTKVIRFIEEGKSNYDCGKHSNFPLCCNLSYSIGDNLSNFNSSKYYKYRRYINQIISRMRREKFGYVPCLFCVMFAKPNVVLSCECHLNEKIMDNRKFLQNAGLSSQNVIVYNNISKIHKIMNIVLDENIIY